MVDKRCKNYELCANYINGNCIERYSSFQFFKDTPDSCYNFLRKLKDNEDTDRHRSNCFCCHCKNKIKMDNDIPRTDNDIIKIECPHCKKQMFVCVEVKLSYATGTKTCDMFGIEVDSIEE